MKTPYYLADAEGFYKSTLFLDDNEVAHYSGLLNAMPPMRVAQSGARLSTLAEDKKAKWKEIKKAREAAIASPLLTTRFGIFDADEVGMANIRSVTADAREAAAIGQAPASIDWTMADNTAVALTPLQLSEVVALLLVRSLTARKRARTVRTQIDAAISTAELVALSF